MSKKQEKQEAVQEEVYVNIALTSDKKMKVDTNLSDLGTIRLLSDVIGVITGQLFEQQEAVAETEDVAKEDLN